MLAHRHRRSVRFIQALLSFFPAANEMWQRRLNREAYRHPQREKILDLWCRLLAAELAQKGILRRGEQAVYSTSKGWLHHEGGMDRVRDIAHPLLEKLAYAHIANPAVAEVFAAYPHGRQFLPALSAHEVMELRSCATKTPPGLVEVEVE